MADTDVDGTTQTDDSQDSNLVKDLRRQIKEANKELSELRPLRTKDTLRQLGLDPDDADSKQAKALLALHGDGEQTPEALRATAEEYGITLPDPTATTPAEPVDEVAAQRTAATAAIDELRNNAAPVGTQKMSWADYEALQQRDPGAAARELMAQRVEVPLHIESAVEANRAERAQQIG